MVRILGIDPGSLHTGYGVIDSQQNRLTHITSGVIHLTKIDLSAKLKLVYERTVQIVKEYAPDEVSIERVFMHRNADSALKLGQARGGAITAIAMQNIKVFEYTANQVKQATVGNGHATKQQVQHMIKILLRLPVTPSADAADALAIALCHAHQREGLARMQGIHGIRHGRLQ